MPVYYPKKEIPLVDYSVNHPTEDPPGKFAINVAFAPQFTTTAPWLTVNGRVGFGFDLSTGKAYAPTAPSVNIVGKLRLALQTQTPETDTDLAYSEYDPQAPDLAVEGKVGVGYTFTNWTGSSSYAINAPSLAVAPGSKVGIGYDLKSGPYDTHAPDLGVQGKVAIGIGLVGGGASHVPYPENAPNLKVQGASSMHGTMDVTNNTGPSNYPILAAVNGLLGQVETLSTVGLSDDVQDAIKHAIENKFGSGKHILMGNLKHLLEPEKGLPNPHNQPYGIHMREDDWFAALNLVTVPKHKPKNPETKVPPVKKSVGNIQWGSSGKGEIPERKDVVLSWGGDTQDYRRRNYLRLRYVSKSKIHILLKDLNGRPISRKAYNRLSTDEKRALAKRRQRSYEIAQNKITALTDPGETGASGNALDLDTASYRDLVVVDPDGSVVVNGAVYSFRNSKISDGRLKEAVEPIGRAIDKILSLRGISFAWKTDEGSSDGQSPEREYGLIAQEVKKVCPQAVSTNHEEVLAVDFDQLTPILIEAIKEQQRIIELQRARMDRMERDLQKLAGTSVKEPHPKSARATAAPRKKSPAPAPQPATQSTPSRTGRAARGPRQ